MDQSPFADAMAIAAPRADLCLDFANTKYWRGSDPPTETLHGAAELAGWAGPACGWPAETTAALAARWQAASAEAVGAHRDALDLREAIYRLFSAVADGIAPASDDLDLLNRHLAQAPSRSRLRAGVAVPVAWSVPAPASDVPTLLAPVLWSAADLLAAPKRRPIRQCANPKCRWLFVDESKGGTRQWCFMSSCGNRAKAHRHYHRKKAAG